MQSIPHIQFLDLAIIFHCLVRNDNDGIGTIRITNEHLCKWNVELHELERLAMENTMRYFPLSLRSMDEVIKEMLYTELYETSCDDLPEDLLEHLFNQENYSNNHNMYILSNQKGINGAACLLYQNAIKDFAHQINSNLYILPSSIHEIILIPDEVNIEKEALKEMVKEVNCTQVAPEEILSDLVYY